MYHHTFSSTDSPQQKFHFAAFTGDLARCKRLIEAQEITINAPDKLLHRTAMHWAAAGNQAAVLRYLVSCGATLIGDWSEKELTRCPEIRSILVHNFKDCGMKFFKPYPITEERNKLYGYHHEASRAAIVYQIKSCRSLEAFTQIMVKYTLQANSYVCGIPLLQLAAWVNVKNTSEFENLAGYRYNINLYKEISYHLLEYGANPSSQCDANLPDDYENTALHALLANERADKATVLLNNARALDISINPNICDVEGKTIFHMSALLRETSFIELCLNTFGKEAANYKDHVGRVGLHYAYLLGDEKTVELFKFHQVNEDIQDRQYNKPYQMLLEPAEEVEKVLLKFHLNPNRTSIDDPVKTLFNECIENRLTMNQKNLVAKEIRKRSFLTAIENGCVNSLFVDAAIKSSFVSRLHNTVAVARVRNAEPDEVDSAYTQPFEI